MKRRAAWPLLGAAASGASAFAAIGIGLYAGGDWSGAALLFGGFGAAAGLVAGVLDRAWRERPPPPQPPHHPQPAQHPPETPARDEA